MSADELAKQAADRVREVIEDAEDRAAGILREAERDAAGIRERADAEAKARLEEVRRALDRIGNGLDPASEVTPGPVTVPEPEPPPIPEPSPPPIPEPAPPQPEPEPGPPFIPEPGQPGEARSGDAAAARLVAMKLALEETPREKARERLASEYTIDDLDALLDDVYAKAGG